MSVALQSEVDRDSIALTLNGRTDLGQPGWIGVSSHALRLGFLPVWPFSGGALYDLFWYFGVVFALCAPYLFASFITRHILFFDLPSALRQRRVSGHVLLTDPKTDSETVKIERGPFERGESTRVAVFKNGAVPKATKRWEPGSILVLSGDLDYQKAIRNPGAKLEELQGVVLVIPGSSGFPQAEEILWTIPRCNSSPAPSHDEPAEVASSLSQAFHSEWNRCSAKEKLTFHQVAKTGFVSASRPELRTLLDRKLLRFGPSLRLRNESFRRFVLAVFRADEIAKELSIEEKESSLSWRDLRVPVGIAISVGAMFLFATQRELWQLAVGLAGSFATASEGLSKLSSLFQTKKSGGSGES